MKRLKLHTMTNTSYYYDMLKEMSNKDESDCFIHILTKNSK